MATGTPNHPPIIVIKRKKGHGGHHGGAWKVAYADFVTAMMALFIVLWLLASDEEVKKAVGGYFTDPSGQGNLMGSMMAGSGDSLSVAKEDLDKLLEKLEQAVRELPELKELEKNVQMTITHEGLRIELLENEGGLWFESGSSSLKDRGREMMTLLGTQLKSLPNRLVVEGHTDAKPYAASGHYTNWELSADRANTARRLLEEAGIQPGRVAQVRGFADVVLRNKADALDPANRRVSVIVQYTEGPPKGSREAAGKGGGKAAGASKSEDGGKAEKPEEANKAGGE
ncbi:MAG: flagellar motor protein MotB [Candidatus Solibacter sp.]|nr:flagellar motor protein MotB [Candidatus Solibacter sp.]